MSGRIKREKAKIEISKPDLPPFLQRLREQLVANEDLERKEQSIKKRKQRESKPDDPDDDPTVVKLGDDDLTEEEYKRMKKDLETQYKLDSVLKQQADHEELNVDDLIKTRCAAEKKISDKSPAAGGSQMKNNMNNSKPKTSTNSRKISYSSSSDEAEED